MSRRDGGRWPIIAYRADEPLPSLQELYKKGEQTVEVVIAPEHMTKDNKRVKARQIWGDTVYTADSDLVAVLMHLGFYAHYLSHPPNTVAEFRALLKLLPPQEKYNSRARFVKSRLWCSPGDGCSYQVERCWLTTRSGATIDLQPCVDEVPAPYPTVQPMVSDRQITTRTTGAKSKYVLGPAISQEVSIQFNLCNEPWLKYTLSAIADKGMKHPGWTSARLRSEVLFLETNSERYQLCCVSTSDDPKGKDLFTFARCKAPLPVSLLQKTGVPQPAELVEVVEKDVDWEDFQWGVSSLHLRGKEFALRRMHFMPNTRGTDMEL
ncbi:hypothetical protein VOLCADRAFT_103146 [Volvox carteri f. nagariensis]|uniref:Uncharacterized protein n=1 Tax=Volvox carteri f. nagariensis TaxID=3068 RepID=D8TJU5_VOLCA|nr:uncharacterized protein VOLCADRAFT_103146 [Volvox carteri f. nagariensis]EFJ52132.1 hypothetical protein VOLCADRAFT_103146 [Volvox carteri f. nagariensis]|eukprot:XP_002946906.1 hypothetical protein VOLCADRAFT_103146 [Volvox carteri f. nagariensis]